MRTLFSLFFLLTAGLSYAQDRCASTDYIGAQKTANASEAQKIEAAENFLQKNASSSLSREQGEEHTTVKIPVVVHVLYKDASQNISDEQVQSQIAALNRDFRRRNADTLNTPERFLSLAADVEIEFALATADPKGRPTNGIVRKYTSTTNWLANDRIKSSAQGGDDAWDSKSFLNIWVGNLVSGAGYSSAPGGDASKDGIVINTSAFGTIGRSGNYSMGRTAVHEVGHWLGLKHIWGDAQCGDDGIGDTPPQGWYTVNCPSGFRSSCSNGTAGDMYMNFMDYTADACMNLFTAGQKKKMLASFAAGGPRASLLQSKGLFEPWAEAATDNAAVAIFPNPASTVVTLALGDDFVGKTIWIYSAAGSPVQSIAVKTPLVKLSVASFTRGMYFVKGEGLSQKFIKL